jgi:GNAT superfamily N-acetyltransferase
MRYMATSGELSLTITDPRSLLAHEMLYAYYDDVASSYYGRPATREEVSSAMLDEPSDDLRGEGGVFVVATRDGVAVGCGGVRFVNPHTGELTRIFVAPSARKAGVGALIVAYLEQQARDAGLGALRLDTRLDLIDARRL